MKNSQITGGKRIVAGILPLVGAILFMNGIGGYFDVLWLAVTGILGLYLTGNLDDLKQRFSLKGYFLGWLLAITALVAGGVLNLLLNHTATSNPILSGHQSVGNFLLLVLFTIVPSLIGEELYTLCLYRAAGSGTVGIIVSTVLFAGVHGFEYHWNAWQLLALVFIRLAFTFVMLRYSVRTSSALHISYDTFLALPTLF